MMNLWSYRGRVTMALARRHLLALPLFALIAAPASAAPITWRFDAVLTVACVATGAVCPAALEPYRPLQGSTARGTLTFDSAAVDERPDPAIGAYRIERWTLELPALDTTWTALVGSIEIGTVDVPLLGGLPCFGCVAAFGYFTENSNPSAPPPPESGSLPFEFRSLGLPFLTDELPIGLASFRTAGGFFVAAQDIQAAPFDVHAIPEPASIGLVGSAAGMLLVRRIRRRQRARRPLFVR